MSEWKKAQIGELFSPLRTVPLSRSQLSDNGVISYIHYGDIHTRWTNWLNLGQEKVPFISKGIHSNGTLLRDGDLVVADASEDLAGVGKTIELVDVCDRLVIGGLHTIALRPKMGVFAPRFAGLIQDMPEFRMQVETLAAGLKVYGLSRRNLSEIEVRIPPIQEQHAIADALSDASERLSELDKQIAKKRDMLIAFLQNCFTGGNQQAPNSNLWSNKALGDLVKIERGEIITKSTSGQGSIPVIAGGLHSPYSTDRANRQGLVITVSASGANAGFVALRKGPLWASDCNTISESAEYDIRFVYAQLKLIQHLIYASQTGGAQPHIHEGDLSPMLVNWCPIEDQTRLGNIFSDIEAEIQVLEINRHKAEMLRQGMVSDLLSGRVRVR